MRVHRYLVLPLFLFLVYTVICSTSVAQGNLPAIVKKIAPSVVVILIYDKEGKPSNQGSGFFINNNGEVITNRHVIEGASSAKVKIADGRVYPAMKILAEDSEGDLACISVDIPPREVRPLSLSAFFPEVGERVVVVGTPLGLEQTVSDGIVSAVREIPAFGKIYQITAPISPGSSGSPVVNTKGEVIGVATFQFVEGQNLNFAIPSERIAKLKTGKGKTFEENVKVTPGIEGRAPGTPNGKEVLSGGVRVYFRITSTGVVVTLKDAETRQEITNAKVTMKVVDPKGEGQIKESKYENGKGYGADFSFRKRGDYQVMVLVKIREKKIPAGVNYRVE